MPDGSLLVLMSPSTVVVVRPPLPTVYFVASSRTIAFQRDLSSAVPLKSSPGVSGEGTFPPPEGRTN